MPSVSRGRGKGLLIDIDGMKGEIRKSSPFSLSFTFSR